MCIASDPARFLEATKISSNLHTKHIQPNLILHYKLFNLKKKYLTKSILENFNKVRMHLKELGIFDVYYNLKLK